MIYGNVSIGEVANHSEIPVHWLEIVKDICDEYLNIKIESPSNYDHIFVVVKIEEMPEDLKNNLIITAKQPSEREQKIRNNIDKLRDR